MAEAASGRVRRDEQGEARRANTAPNGGPHLELGRLQLNTWSRSDLPIAVRVFFALSRSLYPSTSSTPSVRADSSS